MEKNEGDIKEIHNDERISNLSLHFQENKEIEQ